MVESINSPDLSQDINPKDLIIVSAAPAAEIDGKLFLDIKFAEGVNFYCEHWPGRVFCLLTGEKKEKHFAFGRFFERNDLKFEIIFHSSINDEDLLKLKNASTALMSADSPSSLKLFDWLQGKPLNVYLTIELTLETRLKIIFLEEKFNLIEKIYSAIWNLNLERKRLRAIKAARGIQANGYPAFLAYGRLNTNTVTYFDSRLWPQMLANDTDMNDRFVRLSSERPLNIIHSGRLEALKGSLDIVRIAKILKKRGLDFKVQIFGSGSLEAQMKAEVQNHDLSGYVFFHGPVSFEDTLLPYCRSHGDVYLSCHRQSDPSCTYLESMGAGMAIFGYENVMLKHLLLASGGGWSVPNLGDFNALADLLVEKSVNRNDIFDRCKRSLEFSRNHTFEKEFRKRIGQFNPACLG